MIYCIVRFSQETDKRFLAGVPTTSLVEQMYKDFEDYGWMAEDFVIKVYAGHEKLSSNQ